MFRGVIARRIADPGIIKDIRPRSRKTLACRATSVSIRLRINSRVPLVQVRTPMFRRASPGMMVASVPD